MDTSFENLTIGTLATQAQVNVETIRFYQRKGLMHEPGRPQGSVRRYGAGDLGRVRFIKSAQRLEFSLDEIAQLLTLEDGAHCDEAQAQAQQKLIDVRAKLMDLQRIETALSDLVDRCCAVRGNNIRCPLIAMLQGPE
ncbi:MAG: Hg(II)-responsive transcriptional regulator [Rhodoferax sp.]|uniref:Hg(II)-responsive transcriptional regulator n=1 Tax=Rhodoferax sp. TaxID=50421 RepID=UPI0018490520|nr:Hg(II)-responsive transcriptional regulator [Rhodoferax sp.]NMM19806.1 Hg(II)-responsive transcriptional regulator [Rhodoferax sp.]